MKSCLVLEGGGIRGIYTAGVLDVFMDSNIHFDCVIGVSAGAIHGSTYVAQQNGRNIRYYKKYRSDKHFMGFYSLLTTGDIVGKDFCYREIPDILDPFDYEAFKNSQTDFYAVCTDVESGKPVYILIKDMKKQIDCLRASASLPLVSKIVEVNGRKLLDGGISDSIPLKAAQKMGYDKIVVVQTRVKDYIKSPETKLPAKIIYRKYPEFIKSIGNRHIMYNRQTALVKKLEEAGEIISIRPTKSLKIGRMEKNVENIELMYQLGRNDAENKISEVLKFLELH